jgi:hypothetical protein
MNVLKIMYWFEIPEDYTGIVVYHSNRYYYLNGITHRDDGPAVELSNGDRYWYLNGKRHRVNGPAVECSNGDKYWYLNNVYYPQEEWFERLSEEDKENAIWNLR